MLKGITKFIENPAHIFQCVLPPFIESEVLYRHPVYPLSCDENGVFYLDDPRWAMTSTKGNKFYVSPGVLESRDPDDEDVPRYTREEWSAIWKKKCVGRGASVELASRGFLLYECYHGIELGNHARVNRYNHNPYDNRKANLFTHREVPGTYSARKNWLAGKNAFDNQSVIEINNKILQHIEEGRNPAKWYDAMNFPFELRREWENNHGKFGLQPGILDHYRNL